MLPFAELKDRVAIVTGAAQGIGRNTAVTLARHDMPVVLADLNDDRGQRVEAEIRGAGGRAAYVHADVGTMAGCEAMVQTALAAFGGVYALVNNARWHPHDKLVDVTEADWGPQPGRANQVPLHGLQAGDSPHDRRGGRVHCWYFVRSRHPGQRHRGPPTKPPRPRSTA